MTRPPYYYVKNKHRTSDVNKVAMMHINKAFVHLFQVQPDKGDSDNTVLCQLWHEMISKKDRPYKQWIDVAVKLEQAYKDANGGQASDGVIFYGYEDYDAWKTSNEIRWNYIMDLRKNALLSEDVMDAIKAYQWWDARVCQFLDVCNDQDMAYW